MDFAENLAQILPKKVHVLATSLRVRFFAASGRFREAFDELENVLNGDGPNLDVNCRISNLALDELFRAITARTDTQQEVCLASVGVA